MLKGKVVPAPWRRSGRIKVYLHAFFDLGTRWRWVVSFATGRFTARERAPGIHWIGVWVGPRAGLDAVVKRKIPSPRLESNPRTPIVQPVAQRCYTDWATTALILFNVSDQNCVCGLSSHVPPISTFLICPP
jgi:hypothetical protein